MFLYKSPLVQWKINMFYHTQLLDISCAFLLIKKGHSATKALQYMRNSREVQPNLGFLQQLAEKDNDLRKNRYRKYNYKLEEIKYSI